MWGRFIYYINMYLVIKAYLKMEWEHDWTGKALNCMYQPLPRFQFLYQLMTSKPLNYFPLTYRVVIEHLLVLQSDLHE